VIARLELIGSKVEIFTLNYFESIVIKSFRTSFPSFERMPAISSAGGIQEETCVAIILPPVRIWSVHMTIFAAMTRPAGRLAKRWTY
jgi:hypothetical protein